MEKATSKDRTGPAMTLAYQQRKIRAELIAQRTNEAKALAELQVEKVSIDGQRRVVEADMGPIRYLAILLRLPTRTCCGGSFSWWRCCSTRPRSS